MDHKEFFTELITGFLNNKYDRSDVAEKMAMEIGVDEITGDHLELLVNCEMALRHIDEEGYYTTESELRYYLSCLKGKKTFREQDRDESIKQQKL